MRLRLAVALATLAVCAACADGDDPTTGTTTGSPTATPGEPTTSWQPSAPAEPADEATVRATYEPLLDDATAALAAESPGLTWSAPTTRTEEFEGACAVTLERVADGPVPPDDTWDLGPLSAAVRAGGFGALGAADDPGGALRYLADGEGDALFELRSKDSTTVAVRVPTTPDSCAG